MGVLIRGRPSPDIYDEGVFVATVPRLDFAGAGVTVTDDPTNDGVLITIPAGGVTDHGALTGLLDDDHTQYQKESEKGAASGYADLDATTKVPVAQLATGVPDGTKFLRDDRSWQAAGGVTDHGALTGLLDDDHTIYGALAQAETWALLQTFSSGIKLAAAQQIQDSGGTGRFLPATASPHVTLTGDVRADGLVALNTAPTAGEMLRVSSPAGSYATNLALIKAQPASNPTLTANNLSFWGVVGAPTVLLQSGITGGIIEGLDFTLAIGGGGAGTTLSTMAAIRTVLQTFLMGACTITDVYGAWIGGLVNWIGSPTITNYYGVRIGSPGAGATYTNVYGLKIDSLGAGTNRYGLDIGAITAGTIRVGLRNAAPTVYTPTAVQTLIAASAILANATVVQIQSSGNVTVTATPTIADGQDGQILTIINVDTTDTITIQDQGTLALSNLRLGAATRALGPRDSITLLYSTHAAISDWVEIAFSNVI